MKTKRLTAALAAICLSASVQAQKPAIPSEETGRRICGTAAPSKEWDDWFNQKVDAYLKDRQAGRVQSQSYTIPVIVHVIHGGQATGTYPNISQAQIVSQIKVLNQDYSGTGLNVGNLASTGFSVVGAANTGISFCLAQKDTAGQILPEPGIERINYSSRGWTDPGAQNNPMSFQSYIDGTIKPASIWDPTRYLNIWVTDCNAGLLGYGTMPAGTNLTGIPGGTGTSTTDGLFCWAKSFGDTGTLQPPFDLGRTATHELGHWLGLRHIWGDTNCGNDFCNDTPTQQQNSSGCPTYPTVSCSNGVNGNMFMNFMDYTDHACMYMFTPDQNTRMQTAMTTGIYRTQMNASSATLCNVPAASPVATFSLQHNACKDSLVLPKNQTTGNPYPSYVWSASPSVGVIFNPNNTAANPTVKFTTPGSYSVIMSASNSAGSNSSSISILINSCLKDVGLQTESLLKRNISLFPNPSTGLININTSFTESQNLEVTIHDCLGQLLTTSLYPNVSNTTLQLNLNSYLPGLYLVNISNGREKIVQRLILSK